MNNGMNTLYIYFYLCLIGNIVKIDKTELIIRIFIQWFEYEKIQCWVGHYGARLLK